MRPRAIERWHEVVKSPDSAGLEQLLAGNVTFFSPVVHTPQVGKAITLKYLTSAAKVLNNGTFKYVNEWYNENSAVLEFTTTVDGILIDGVDLIQWDSDDRIVNFKVMVRPLKAINLLHQMMMRALQTPAA